MTQTIVESFWSRVSEIPHKAALIHKQNGSWKELSFNMLGDRLERLGCGLLALQVKKGDRIALISQTRYEWTLADLACLSTGAVTVPIYPTVLEEDVAYIIQNSDAKVAFVEDDTQLDKILSQKAQLPDLDTIIVFAPSTKIDGKKILSLAQLEDMGRDKKDLNTLKQGFGVIKDNDLATIVYTSGTTGLPKGAMISHKNIMFNLQEMDFVFPPREDDRTIAYLPLSHVYERFNQFTALHRGFPYAFAESLEKMAENLADIKPTIMPGVPRVYEKLFNRIQQKVDSGPYLGKLLFNWALGVGSEVLHCKDQGKQPSLTLKAQHLLASKLVFSKLKQRLGGRVRYCICAAAPMPKEIAEFFLSLDIPIFEGYGMTETMAPTSLNHPRKNRAGTVGPVFPHVACRIADDGEILLKGDNIFMGYHKLQHETQEVLEDGWLHTGDLGAIDQDGFLKITGRKKELIITSGGKNIPTNKIENAFMTSPYIGQCVPCGDGKPYLVAIMSLDQAAITEYAAQHQIAHDSFSDLVKNQRIVDLVDSVVKDRNKDLASFESIKYFHLADHEFSIESGELTPTLKVKKKVVFERYQQEIEQLYTRAKSPRSK